MRSLPSVRAMLVAVLLCAGCVRTSPRFYAPLFGPGRLTNIGETGEANANALAHTGFALAIPLAGNACYGRQGLWITGLGWIGYSLVNELMFHAPDNPGDGYPSEFRTDLITRILPTAAVLTLDLLLRRDP